MFQLFAARTTAAHQANRSTNEPGLAGVTIYSDLNLNGRAPR